MVASVVLTTLTSVRACTQLIHGQRQRLVSLDAQRTKRHSTSHEVLYNTLHGLHLVDRSRLGSLLETKEVADKDGRFLLVDNLSPILKLLVVTLSGSQLQFGNCLRIPGMFDTVLTPSKLTLVL